MSNLDTYLKQENPSITDSAIALAGLILFGAAILIENSILLSKGTSAPAWANNLALTSYFRIKAYCVPQLLSYYSVFPKCLVGFVTVLSASQHAVASGLSLSPPIPPKTSLDMFSLKPENIFIILATSYVGTSAGEGDYLAILNPLSILFLRALADFLYNSFG